MKRIVWVLPLVILGLMVACIPQSGSLPPGWAETNAAYTLSAILTRSAFTTLEAQLTQLATPINATQSPSSPPSTLSSLPTLDAAQLSSTLAFTLASDSPCNAAKFIKDVSIPDGEYITPGQKFTKIWRIQNIGSCIWNQSYNLIYSGSEDFKAPHTNPLNSASVKPGDTIDISLNMVAPQKPGTYISYWNLSDPQDQLFGIGANADGVIWVKIQVANPGERNPLLAFSLTEKACQASWTDGENSLPCPGTADPTNGSIEVTENVTIEGGMLKNLPGLITIPGENGYIFGLYPSFLVSAGDHFTATIGCLDDHPACDVIFEIKYRTESGVEKSLASWGQILDSYSHDADIDLSSLAGQNIQLLLIVSNNGDSQDDFAFWMNPAVWHQDQ